MGLDYFVMICTGQRLMTPEDDDMGGFLVTFWSWFATWSTPVPSVLASENFLESKFSSFDHGRVEVAGYLSKLLCLLKV